MSRIRFVMIGGFLGAGKTTAIARLARHHIDAGRRVGVVTNDQAYDLVDTHSLRAQGFRVGEVPGACFCCKFDDLIATTAQLEADEVPDVIVTEPVGSCTDLVATVIEPLRRLHDNRYDVAPLVVLLKPEHGRKILAGSGSGFSPEAEYIFLKQVEEADIVVVNKADKLSIDARQELVDLVAERFPGKRVFAASGRTGEGFDAVVRALEETGSRRSHWIELDYDRYAAGEAELGWLNGTATLAAEGDATFDLDRLVVAMTDRIASALSAADAEPAHLKILAESDGKTSIANLVGSDSDVELSLPSRIETRATHLVINARVAVDPERLAETVRASLEDVARDAGLRLEVGPLQHFRPGRPEPTHRLSASD